MPRKLIAAAELQGHHTYLLNAETARHFFHSTQHYYAETIRQINQVTDQLDEQLDAGVLRDIQELSLQ